MKRQTLDFPEGVTEPELQKIRKTADGAKEVIISEGVTTIPCFCFFGCRNIEKIVLPGTVRTIGFAAFSGCSSLSSVNIPEGVTEIDMHTFAECTSLRSIELPSTLEKIGDEAFISSGLESIDLPDSLSLIGECAFRDCGNLRSARIPAHARLGRWSFKGCTNFPGAPVVDAELACRLKAEGGLTICQYRSSMSQGWMPYLVRDIVRRTPEESRPVFGRELSLVSDGCDMDRIYVAKGLEDTDGEADFMIRTWDVFPCMEKSIRIEWSCYNMRRTVTDGCCTGPETILTGVTTLCPCGKSEWRVTCS